MMQQMLLGIGGGAGFKTNGNDYSFLWTGDPIEMYSEFNDYLADLPTNRPIWIKFDMWVSPTTTKTVGAAAIVNEITSGYEMQKQDGSNYYTTNQRIISLSGMVTPASSYTSFSMVGSDQQLISHTNDDKESYFMNYRGDVVMHKDNANNFLQSNVYVARDGSTISSDVSILNATILGDANLIPNDSNGSSPRNHYVAFPLANQAVFLHRRTGDWSMIGNTGNTNDWYEQGPNGATTAEITSQWGSGWETVDSRNNYAHMSDGIKSFWLHHKNKTYVLLCEMNYKTQSIQSDWINQGSSPENQLQQDVEEDMDGDQLFSLNGGSAWAYQVGSGTVYKFHTYWGWRHKEGIRRTSGQNGEQSVTINGSYTNQTGQDVCGTIKSTSDYRVTFVDHGHDNGGLFNFGNDDGLGARDTDITVPGHYTVSNPPNTWWSS